MRAGQAGHAVEAGLGGQEARDLRLLAPHHVGRRGLAEAGDDADVERPGRTEGGPERGAGDGAVGRLDPALAGAHHAAGDGGALARTQEVAQGALELGRG